MIDAPPPCCDVLPFGEDLPTQAAARLLADHAPSLPDLSAITVVVPHPDSAPQLRRALLSGAAEQGFNALLGPKIVTLVEWLAAFPLPHPVIGQHGRELLLVEALREHQGLFGSGSLWNLADALLELFDELTLNQVGLPETLAQFRQRIARAYGAELLDNAGLEMETRLVYTLWHAWHAQLRDSGQIDSATATVLRLSGSLAQPLAAPLYLLAPLGDSRAERTWLQRLLHSGQAVIFLQGEAAFEGGDEEYLPDGWLREVVKTLGIPLPTQAHHPPYKALLHQLYDRSEPPLQQRAADFARQHPVSPLINRLAIFSAESSEQEARAVELQVRLWLLQGKAQIGIVTENRRLARRVRALLERAGIVLDDAAGWALSTTSAAAVVERWLECVEEDFPWRPLLDLLKSPFFVATETRAAHLESVYRLEQQIIHNDNIGSGLNRYRARIVERHELLSGEVGDPTLLQLLTQLEKAAEWLAPALGDEAMAAERMIDLLVASLRELGLHDSLQGDAAGMRLLDELQQMRAAAASGKHRMAWQEFRGWLGRTLERYNFRPASGSQSVQLMSLAQSELQHFDAVILAGAEQEYLPGGGGNSPFFNDQVRRDLGLPTREQRLAKRFHLYHHLLEAAPSLLVTHRREEHGEEIPRSPWLELLVAFHRLAWQTEPTAEELSRLLANPASEVTQREAPLPQVEGMPAPPLPTALIPKRFSASGYQQLINCPYRFFAARGLKLAPAEAIREALEKADYGEKVHRCLQAFHDGVAGLPGPFPGLLDSSRRDEAITLLEAIADAEFLHGIGERFENRGWLNRWRHLIPHYIDWQLEHQQQWQLRQHEANFLRDDLVATITLHGRIDRLEQGGEGSGVIDYKTGRGASHEELLAGESVQLPFYALLAEEKEHPVAQVAILRLDEGKVATPVTLAGEELQQLKEENLERLAGLIRQLREGAPLPAWGDDGTCSRCDMEGLCRRQVWPL